MDIAILKKDEMQEIKDFCNGIEEFGHIFLLDPKLLDEPFKDELSSKKPIKFHWGLTLLIANNKHAISRPKPPAP